MDKDEAVVIMLRAENKSLHQQLETMRQDRDYYRDAYHHLLKEQQNVKDD